MERAAEGEHGGRGLEGGHPGDPRVDLVEQQVHAGIGERMVVEVLRQLGQGAELPEAVHQLGQMRRRRELAVADEGGGAGDAVADGGVHGEIRRREGRLGVTGLSLWFVQGVVKSGVADRTREIPRIHWVDEWENEWHLGKESAPSRSRGTR